MASGDNETRRCSRQRERHEQMHGGKGGKGCALKILKCWKQWGVMEGYEQRRAWGAVLSLSFRKEIQE